MGENNCRLSVWEVYFCFPLPHTRPYAHRERLNKTLRSPPSAAARSVQGTALAASLPETPYVLDGELKIPQ